MLILGHRAGGIGARTLSTPVLISFPESALPLSTGTGNPFHWIRVTRSLGTRLPQSELFPFAHDWRRVLVLTKRKADSGDEIGGRSSGLVVVDYLVAARQLFVQVVSRRWGCVMNRTSLLLWEGGGAKRGLGGTLWNVSLKNHVCWVQHSSLRFHLPFSTSGSNFGTPMPLGVRNSFSFINDFTLNNVLYFLVQVKCRSVWIPVNYGAVLD